MPINISRSDALKISRREALKILGTTGGMVGLGATALGVQHLMDLPSYHKVPGRIVGANNKVGHLLREAVKARPGTQEQIGTLIVGGGIAGLSAGWWLQRHQDENFRILELDDKVGGNSMSGENHVSKYPWAAHYVPLPSPDATYVRALFEELGIITGYAKNLPVYNEFYLCADPHERLLYNGTWSEGLVPNLGLSADERRVLKEFFAFTDSLKNKKGRDGQIIFNIPLEHSSRDSEYLAWDRISFHEFLKTKGWDAKPLLWYVDYCCRDDYGFRGDQVSAWAGLHYFASRSGSAANADSQTVITWPEGNAFLAQKLAEKLKAQILTGRLAFRIEHVGDKVWVDVIRATDGTLHRYVADHVIYAGPRFTASHVIKDLPKVALPAYAPWVVANITVSNMPETEGAPLSWDNVSFYSPSLGYIVANHQDLTQKRREKVLTYYLPLDESDAKTERIKASKRDFASFRDEILKDLDRMHPRLSRKVTSMEVMVWGHGMPSPGIDYVWNAKRDERFANFDRIHFAHADQSGISVFEEAQFRGVEAARQILSSRAKSKTSPVARL